MYTQDVKTVLDQADELFDTAREELFKPEEDVVYYMVCQNAFKSIHKYLTWYLLKNGTNLPDDATLEALLKQCREIDNTFNNLELAPLLISSGDEDDVWVDIETAKEFMELAAQTRNMVAQKQ